MEVSRIKPEGRLAYPSFDAACQPPDINDHFCQRCNNRYFENFFSKLQHIADSSKHNVCCNFDYETEAELVEHFITSPEHSYCTKCDEHFEEKGHGQLFWDHLINSPRHNFCRSCQVELPTDEALNEHLELVHFCCIRCNKQCGTEEKLEVHWQVSERHWKCTQCFRDFPIENQLLRHQKAHLPRSIGCPRCEMGFCSNSALIIHWENGACFPSRQVLNQYIRQFDVNGSMVPLADRDAMSYNERRTKQASEKDWNGDTGTWECRLCTDRYFESFAGLNNHLESPFHDMPSFRCNGCRLNGKESRFTCLSGLIQHVEDTGCGYGGKGSHAVKLMNFLNSAVSSR